jgi:8-oxo-dGTP pyrophosphatase MutT (NUDIX family)
VKLLGQGLVTLFLYNTEEEKNPKVIMVQKLDHEGEPFALPGGEIEDGEDADQAIIREIKAECGDNIGLVVAESLKDDCVDVLHFERFGKGGVTYPQYIYIIEYSGEIPLPQEGVLEEGEELGPPKLVKVWDTALGWIRCDDEKHDVPKSHLNAIYQVCEFLGEECDCFKTIAQATQKFEFSRPRS